MEGRRTVTTLPPLEDRVLDLLKRVSTDIRPCRACGTMLYFVGHANGKIAPYTADAVNHFINCPEAARFRKERQA